MEIVVALDDKTCDACTKGLADLPIHVVRFTSNGVSENGYRVIRYVKSDFALMLADDEIPSEPLWDFAQHPPQPARYGVPIVPILGDKMMTGHTGIQERLIWVDGWRWVGREVDGKHTLFEGHSEADTPLIPLLVDTPTGRANTGMVIWHYLLEAPREEREAKAARYKRADPYGDHESRLFYEDRDCLEPIPEDLKRLLPAEK